MSEFYAHINLAIPFILVAYKTVSYKSKHQYFSLLFKPFLLNIARNYKLVTIIQCYRCFIFCNKDSNNIFNTQIIFSRTLIFLAFVTLVTIVE